VDRRGRFAGLVLILGAVLSAAAGQTPPIVRTAVGYDFGVRLTFAATIFSAGEIVRAAVFYRPAGGSDTEVLLAELTPGTPTIARAVQDLRQRPLPPFRPIVYWWQVDFADRTMVVTPEETFRYEDDRFVWQFLNEGRLAVHWVEGDLEFARDALDAGASGLARLRSLLFLEPNRSIDIYLYPSIGDLESALALTGRSWTAGHSDPSLSVILLPIPPGPEARLEFERLIPHELTHLLLFERMGEGYAKLPAWMNEGLATTIELSPDPRYRAALEDAIANRQWLDLEGLCAAVPSSGAEALLAYAQSASLIGYLRDVYGSGSIVALLDAYQEGASCTGGLERVLRRSPRVLLQEWADYVQDEEEPGALGPMIAGLVALGAGGVTAWAVRRRRMRRRASGQASNYRRPGSGRAAS